jgi:mycothiol synthase
MTAFTERPLTAETAGELQTLLREPGLAASYEQLSRPDGVADLLADPHLDAAGAHGAYVDGAAAGFRLLLTFAAAEGPWALVMLGVAERCRRRGIGSALLARTRERLLARPGAPPRELCLAGWLPDAAAEGFAARHGFRPARTFWLMERPLGGAAAPQWPAGIEIRIYDGSEAALVDWMDAYNDSFAEHYHFVPATLETTRALVAQSLFLPEALLLAYRGGRCVGYVRSLLLEQRGEVGILGVVAAARGLGLGRALLRASVRWLEERRSPRVTLMVDGDNENALRLYRQEGFAVARTRQIWSREP